MVFKSFSKPLQVDQRQGWSDAQYLEICKKNIALSLNLHGEVLTQRDFEYLKKRVFEKSGIALSTATLRRIWSDQNQRTPQIKTLDALAQAIDFESWHDFKRSQPSVPKGNSTSPLKKGLIFLFLIIMVGMAAAWMVLTNEKELSQLISFHPEKEEAEGIPATIGFNYDIKKINQELSIELSWNPYERTILDPSKSYYTGTYFYPDFHEAKILTKDNQILSKKFVHITTPEWHGLIMKSSFDSNPIYVNRSDFVGPNYLSISKQLESKYQLQDEREIFPVFTLSNKSLEKVSGDHFKLSTQLKIYADPLRKTCHQVDILLKGQMGAMRIPISFEGCHGLTAIKCGNEVISGKTNDLSNLSYNFDHSFPVEISNEKSELSIQVGTKQVFKHKHREKIGALKVVKFIFTDYGEIQKFELKSKNIPFKDNSLVPF